MKKKKPRQLYRKLFCNYTVIVLCIVSALILYFISASKNRVLDNNQKEMQRVLHEAAGYIQETEGIADYITKELYRQEAELEDLLAYFQMGEEEYQRYSLDRYSATEGVVYKGILNFIDETFEANHDLEKIELIGYKDFRLTECYPNKTYYPGKDGKKREYEIRQSEYGEYGKLVYAKEVRNPNTLEDEGCLIFTFDGEENFQEIKSHNAYTDLTVFFENENMVYGNRKAPWDTLLEDERYLVLRELEDSYRVCAWLDKKAASALPWSTALTILGVGILAIILGIVCIEYYVRRLTKRVNRILGAMNEVTTGNLHNRIPVKNNSDELDMIAANFNDMCENLELYIQKSYLAEIERKNAQMQALQSQINPHFLYNTLEAIRMKAICNGDREVGKMLYSMVVLFRSQLKEADVITLGQELNYCRQYLELFEYRYPGTFQYQVDCSTELLGLPIIKFVLQPILENYFIHGIERDRKDNLIVISAEKSAEILTLYVRDNGQGMEPEKIKEKNQELIDNAQETAGNASIGITNVNRRIKAVYGEGYGISMEAVKPQGLLVKIRIKVEEGEGYEKGNVSGG